MNLNIAKPIYLTCFSYIISTYHVKKKQKEKPTAIEVNNLHNKQISPFLGCIPIYDKPCHATITTKLL